MKREENNNLKAEFTVWLNILANHAKLSFIRKGREDNIGGFFPKNGWSPQN